MRTCKRCEGECASYYILNDPHIYWTTLCEGCHCIVVNTWPGFRGRYRSTPMDRAVPSEGDLRR